MDLNDYFDPVSLEKPADSIGASDEMFGRNIRINTASNPIDEISNYQLAILGVNEDRNSRNTGSANAPDNIRRKLYELYRINDKLRIIDLGNLKNTASPQDTYFGLRDVMTDLLNNQVTAIVIGGTHDLGAGLYMAFEQTSPRVNVVTIDSRIDMNPSGGGSFSWNIPVINSPRIFRYTSLGHQQYLVDPSYPDALEDKGFDVVRLGMLRSNLMLAEPFIRDANLVTMDIGAIRQSEAPGTKYPSPNGLLAEEACQLARYAGMSDLVSCFGIFEVNSLYDSHDQTSQLVAQAVWYFAEGYTQRKKEKPSQNSADFKVFLVNHSDMEHALTFYKSLITGRWWMEIPEMKTGSRLLVACTQEEYQQACNHEIPDMWWKAFQRIN